MNNKLQTLLTQLPTNLANAESNDAIKTVVVDLENAVLRSNLEETSDTPFVSRDYVVGEANTRGLSWKLNLLRLVATANFCQLMRIGVHGGNTRVLGQEENLDTTFQVYDALTDRYAELSAKEFESFSDARSKEENAEKVHRVGWVGKFLIDAPTEVFAAVEASRQENASAKVTALIEKKNEGLNQLRATFAPVRTPAAPKAPKAPKEGKRRKKTDAEIIAEQNAAAEGSEGQESETGSESAAE